MYRIVGRILYVYVCECMYLYIRVCRHRHVSYKLFIITRDSIKLALSSVTHIILGINLDSKLVCLHLFNEVGF